MMKTMIFDESHYNLGNILTDEECYEDAKKEYESALELEPTNADYLNSLGYVLVELGQQKKAKENFEAAIYSDSTHSKAHHNLRAVRKISETKILTVPRGLMAAIILVSIITYYLFCHDKLAGTEFVALVVFLMSLLTATVLFSESNYFKVGPSGLELSRDTEGKAIKPKSAEFIK